jgi:nucleotide-binding universal stress UspA family protein
MIKMQHVLVATDFSGASETALNYGRDLARRFGATLHVLHVADNVMARFAADAYPTILPDLQQEVERTAQQRLEELLTDEDRRELKARPVLRTSTAPAREIVEYATESGANVIVMGTHGRGAVARVLMGSVAERVVRTAPCPVLTIRHPEREFVPSDVLTAVAGA